MSKRKAKATAQNAPSSEGAKEEVAPAHEIVEAARMRHGDPGGDIVGSYSGDRICENRPIRTPFHFRGGLWVCVGTWGELAAAYRVVSAASSAVAPTTYSEKTGGEKAAENAKNAPNGFYHGMTVKHVGQSFVMTGPEVTFAPGEVGQAMLPARPMSSVRQSSKPNGRRSSTASDRRSAPTPGACRFTRARCSADARKPTCLEKKNERRTEVGRRSAGAAF